MRDISDFEHLALDVPQNYMHDILLGIENNPNIVAQKKEVGKEQWSEKAKKKAAEKTTKKNNEDQS